VNRSHRSRSPGTALARTLTLAGVTGCLVMGPTLPACATEATASASLTSRGPTLTALELETVQRETLVTLGTWSALSIVSGGLGLMLAPDPFGRAIATQAVAWGAIDGGIAAWGALQPGGVQDPARRQEDLARLFGLNALLDVGYLALGAWLASSERPDQRGHGTGVLIQGTFLLVLDGLRTWQLWPR